MVLDIPPTLRAAVHLVYSVIQQLACKFGVVERNFVLICLLFIHVYMYNYLNCFKLISSQELILYKVLFK